MHKNIKHLAPAMACLALIGCAGHPDRMAPSYVSPIAYNNYSCPQLMAEEKKVNAKATELYGHLKDEADADAAQMFVGLVLFWPVLFFLEGGDGPEAAEYTQLTGKNNAIQDAKKAKNCVQVPVHETSVIATGNTNDAINLVSTENLEEPAIQKMKDMGKVSYFYSVANGCKTQRYYLNEYAFKNPNISGVINKKVKTYKYDCLTNDMNAEGKKVHTLRNFKTLIDINRDDTIVHFRTAS